jgi:hypothetical protein
MKKALINLKDFIILILAAIVYLAPITFLSFGLILGWIIGGVIEKSLELDYIQSIAVKFLSILGVIGMFTYGVMDAKYRLDGNIDESEKKKLRMAWGISAFCLLNVLLMFFASCGWLSLVGYTPNSLYELKGWNNYVAIVCIIAEPMLTFYAGILTLQYIADIYPELRNQTNNVQGGINDKGDMVLKREFETLYNTLNSIPLVDKVSYNKVNGQVGQLSSIVGKIVDANMKLELKEKAEGLREKCKDWKIQNP